MQSYRQRNSQSLLRSLILLLFGLLLLGMNRASLVLGASPAASPPLPNNVKVAPAEYAAYKDIITKCMKAEEKLGESAELVAHLMIADQCIEKGRSNPARLFRDCPVRHYDWALSLMRKQAIPLDVAERVNGEVSRMIRADSIRPRLDRESRAYLDEIKRQVQYYIPARSFGE